MRKGSGQNPVAGYGARVVAAAWLAAICAALWAQRPTENPHALGAAFRKAPESAQALKNPYQGQTTAILAGRKLFQQHCAECHGSDGRGRGKAADLESPAIQDAPSGVLFWFLRNGNRRQGMPSWSGLPDQQRWQLVAYLQRRR